MQFDNTILKDKILTFVLDREFRQENATYIKTDSDSVEDRLIFGDSALPEIGQKVMNEGLNVKKEAIE
jgi:hypothetical protein